MHFLITWIRPHLNKHIPSHSLQQGVAFNIAGIGATWGLWENGTALCWDKIGSDSTLSATQHDSIQLGAALANHVHASIYYWWIPRATLKMSWSKKTQLPTLQSCTILCEYYKVLCCLLAFYKLFKHTLYPSNWTSWMVFQHPPWAVLLQGAMLQHSLYEQSLAAMLCSYSTFAQQTLILML